MNTVMIIPTGIGCEIGGHAGDANPVAKLLGSVSDTLILHPNVVNASDINEMPQNALYVEGSILDRFLEGSIELQPVKNNKILIAVNSPVRNGTINAVSASRVTLGIDVKIIELDTPLEMIATMNNGKSTGIVNGWEELIQQISSYTFDALAITTPVIVAEKIAKNYLENGGVNPWGGVEAKASRLIATVLNKPVAHSPMDTESNVWIKTYNPIVDPRIAPEMISVCYLQCILKGLHKSPKIGKGLSIDDIDVLVSPYGCWGRPHEACYAKNIPIIMVKENKTIFNKSFKSNTIIVQNYLEAVGFIKLLEQGLTLESVTRPISKTIVIKK